MCGGDIKHHVWWLTLHGQRSNDQVGGDGGMLMYAFSSFPVTPGIITLISILVTHVATLTLVLEELSTHGFCLVYMATLDH